MPKPKTKRVRRSASGTVRVPRGVLASLDRACKATGLPVTREFMVSALCHLAAICLASKKGDHVLLREMFVRAMATSVLDRHDDDVGPGPLELVAAHDVRRAVHEVLDDMAAYLSQVSDHDPQMAVAEIHRIRLSVGPILQKPNEREIRPGFDGRA